MELIYTLDIPMLPVSTNSLYGLSKNSKQGNRHMFLSKKGKALHDAICREVVTTYGLVDTIEDKVAVNIIITKKHNRMYDLDNCLKGILDGLTKADVWEDDSLVDQLMIRKNKGTFNNIHIEIYKLED